MHLTRLSSAVAVMVALSAPTAMAACAKPSFSSTQMRAIPTSGINQAVFSDALIRDQIQNRG